MVDVTVTVSVSEYHHTVNFEVYNVYSFPENRWDATASRPASRTLNIT